MSERPVDTDIVVRMKDFFERQIAWFETVKDDLARLGESADPDESDRLVFDDNERAKKSRALEEEFRVLKKEWDASRPADGAGTEAVRSLAHRAEELGLALQESIDDAAKELLARSIEVREEIEKLQQGKSSVSKYRAPKMNDTNYMDRKA